MSFDKFNVVLKVIAIFDEMDIPYLIGGSFASSLYGWSRSTNDADLLAVIRLDQVSLLVQKLETEFYVSEQAARRAVQSRRHFNFIHVDTAFKVDVFVAKTGGFTEQQLQRRQLRGITPNQQPQAYFASPEDTVLAKLDWYRRGNEVSDMQWRDVLNVIKVQGERLDLDYMRQWAKELGVADLLEQAISEAKKLH
jgi:hypothetical protein